MYPPICQKIIYQILMSVLFSFIYLISEAQEKEQNSTEIVPLSLEEAVEQALSKNWEIRKAQKDTDISKADFASTRATYLPQITLSETGVFTNSPLQTFGILLNQSRVVQNDFNPDILNNPSAISNFNTQFSIQQPIFNAGGFYGRKAAESQVKAQQMMSTRTEKGITMQVKQAYFQLQLAQESQIVIQKAIDAAKATQNLTKQNFEEGYVQNADLMLVEIRVLSLQNQLADAQNQLSNASENLVYLLNMPQGSSITATDKLSESANISTATGEISEQRSDFQAQRFGIQAREQMLLSHKKSLLPSLNAFGAFELNDNIPFGAGANNWMAGFRLQWDIFKGYSRTANTQKAQAELDKANLAYEQSLMKSDVELNQAKRNVTLNIQKLNTTKLAIKQAEEVLRIRKDRYEEGLEKTNEVLMAEAQVAEKELEYLQNLYAYQVATYYLDFLLEN